MRRAIFAAAVAGLGLVAVATLPRAASADLPVVPTAASQGGYCEYGACYYWVGASQWASASGAAVSLTQNEPLVGPNDTHSLAEMAIESTDQAQIIEVGWTVDPSQFGDPYPHLFVYHWVNGNPTCYNGCGFVAAAGAPLPVGGVVAVGATGRFKMAYANSRWTVTYDGSPVGYFPGSLWNGAFTSTGLIQVFGEVAASEVTAPATQMGDGLFGTQKGSALISRFSLVQSTSTPSLGAYDLGGGLYNDGYVGPLHLRFGGPG
jgi:hypothetical protein